MSLNKNINQEKKLSKGEEEQDKLQGKKWEDDKILRGGIILRIMCSQTIKPTQQLKGHIINFLITIRLKYNTRLSTHKNFRENISFTKH